MSTPVTHELTDEQCDDIITTAIQGGVNYWSTTVAYDWDAPVSATLVDDSDNRLLDITRDTIRKGWDLLYTEPFQYLLDHYGEINVYADGDIDVDANGADNIVQLGLFGEVVYA